MPFRTETVRNGVYVELVRSLYTTMTPTTIMSIGYVLSFGAMAYEANDAVLCGFAIAGIILSAARLAVLLHGRADAEAIDLIVSQARKLERRFAIVYYQFAILVGLSSAYVFLQMSSSFHTLMMCLLVGYGAGVAAGIGLRPWIAIPSMMVATTPAVIAAAMHWDSISWVTAAMTTAFLVGGAHSVIRRYRAASKEVAKRLTFEALARHDVLTALPNRLALREWFDRHVVTSAGDRILAVHCLDLDNFKPVNDVFGHPVGDALLKAIAIRLTRSLRPGDIAARLGGDEFAVIQQGVRDPEEAEALAQRLRVAVAEPFVIQGHDISVSTGVGYALSRRTSADLDDLLSLADQALYTAKKGSGIQCDDSLMNVSGRLAA